MEHCGGLPNGFGRMAMSIKIGIISAMEREVARYVSGWGAVRIQKTPFTMRTDRSGATAYVASGIGREPGITASEALVAAFKPDVLVSAGFAGALIAERKVGDAVLVGVVVDGTTGESFRTESSSNRRIVSSGFIANRNAKLELHSRYNAEAVDMEGAAVGTVAKRHGIPFYAVKTISDELDFPMLPFGSFVDSRGRFQITEFLGHVSLRPAHWPGLIRMGRNSSKAAAKLREELEHLTKGIRQARAVQVN
jgi:adenosylhomocysteine nucleosidase